MALLVLPLLLVLTWCLLWIVRRRVGWPFFVGAFGLALLCFAAAVLVDRASEPAPSCRPYTHCRGLAGNDLALTTGELILDGYLTLWCGAALLALTLPIELTRYLVRRYRRQ